MFEYREHLRLRVATQSSQGESDYENRPLKTSFKLPCSSTL